MRIEQAKMDSKVSAMAIAGGFAAVIGLVSLILAGHFVLSLVVGVILIGLLVWTALMARGAPQPDQPAQTSESAPGQPLEKSGPEPRAGLDDQNLLHTLIDNLPDCVAVKDTQGRFLFANSAQAWFLGRTAPDDLVGKTMADFFPPSFAAQFEADDQAVVKSGQLLVKNERCGKDRLGNLRWLACTTIPLRDLDGQIRSIISISRDITGRKQADEALRQSEKRYRTLIESLPQQVFYKDTQSAFLSVNAAFAKDLVLKPEELIGKTDFDLYPKELAEKYRQDDLRIMIQRRVEVLEEVNVTKDGRQRIVEVVKSPVFDNDDNVIGLLGIFTDITERKQAEQKLKAFATQLEHSNRELQDFAYVASHDLQEPLRKVNVFSDRLKTKCGSALGQEGAHYLDRIQDATKRMQSLINDLLTFSRVTTQTHPCVPVNLTTVVREVLSDLEARLEQVNGKVEVGDLPTIEADTLQMRQLFQNVIGNALKYHKPDVSPLVQVGSQLLPRPSSGAGSLEGEPEFCQITVSDNGIGFDEKYRERIFQVFQRLHSRGVYEGSGMGLAICRKITDRHHGEITAKSKPGEGSTFIITLPIKHTGGDEKK